MTCGQDSSRGAFITHYVFMSHAILCKMLSEKVSANCRVPLGLSSALLWWIDHICIDYILLSLEVFGIQSGHIKNPGLLLLLLLLCYYCL